MSLAAVIALLVSVPLALALLRANELFCLKLRDGRLHVARGRIPQALLDDLADVLRRPPVARGTLRGVVEDRRVRVLVDADLTDAQHQQIRNVVAAWPIVKVRNAPPPRR